MTVFKRRTMPRGELIITNKLHQTHKMTVMTKAMIHNPLTILFQCKSFQKQAERTPMPKAKITIPKRGQSSGLMSSQWRLEHSIQSSPYFTTALMRLNCPSSIPETVTVTQVPQRPFRVRNVAQMLKRELPKIRKKYVKIYGRIFDPLMVAASRSSKLQKYWQQLSIWPMPLNDVGYFLIRQWPSSILQSWWRSDQRTERTIQQMREAKEVRMMRNLRRQYLHL